MERALHAAGYALPHAHPETLGQVGDAPTQVTFHLAVTLPALPGLTRGLLEEALAGVLDKSAFTVQAGVGSSPAPVTPRELGRDASRRLTAAGELGLYEDALQAVRTLLQGEARAGWAEDHGPTRHGRLRAD